MVKAPQIKDLQREGFHFITTITKPQIESLLSQGILQMDLFDAPLAQISVGDEVRIFSRMPAAPASGAPDGPH